MRGKTSFVGVVVVIGLVSALGGPDYDAAYAAAFRELLQMAPGYDAVPGRSVCLAVSSAKAEQSRNRRDPESSVLARLKVEGRQFYPASRCLEDAAGVWDPFHREAVLLSIGGLDWVSRNFVKVEGYWLLDGLSAQGFRLTLSYVRGKWHVDTAVPRWVS